jgi:hypothetical protein
MMFWKNTFVGGSFCSLPICKLEDAGDEMELE